LQHNDESRSVESDVFKNRAIERQVCARRHDDRAAFFALFFISRPGAARQAMLVIEIWSRRVGSDMALIGLLAFVVDRRDGQFRKLVL
jgi:hypothetical protein